MVELPSAVPTAPQGLLASLRSESELPVASAGSEPPVPRDGCSMLAVRVIALARKAFAVTIPLQALFATPIVAGLARYIAASGGEQFVPRGSAR